MEEDRSRAVIEGFISRLLLLISTDYDTHLIRVHHRTTHTYTVLTFILYLSYCYSSSMESLQTFIIDIWFHYQLLCSIWSLDISIDRSMISDALTVIAATWVRTKSDSE